MAVAASTPTEITDPLNARILEVSEDRIAGFLIDPFAEIARLADVDAATVHERLRAMLAAGTIRRIRQTLMATNLAPGALVAWRVPSDRLDAAFDFMWKEDPFSGHIVIRSTDAETTGSAFRLWTTLKVPQGFSMARHCDVLAARVGAETYRIMPAKRLFALGVGHVRRRGIEPGSKTDGPGQVIDTNIVELSDLEWRVLEPLKREFAVEEIVDEPWRARAREAGLSLDEFASVARSLNERGVIGRFSTFLEHVKPSTAGTRGRPPSHPHACVLARGRARLRRREHHGGRARHREARGARAQGGDRRALGGDWDAGAVHECVLGRKK